MGRKGALGAPSLSPKEKSNEDGLGLIGRRDRQHWGGTPPHAGGGEAPPAGGEFGGG